MSGPANASDGPCRPASTGRPKTWRTSSKSAPREALLRAVDRRPPHPGRLARARSIMARNTARDGAISITPAMKCPGAAWTASRPSSRPPALRAARRRRRPRGPRRRRRGPRRGPAGTASAPRASACSPSGPTARAARSSSARGTAGASRTRAPRAERRRARSTRPDAAPRGCARRRWGSSATRSRLASRSAIDAPSTAAPAT